MIFAQQQGGEAEYSGSLLSPITLAICSCPAFAAKSNDGHAARSFEEYQNRAQAGQLGEKILADQS
jgi:hypothetical protein